MKRCPTCLRVYQDERLNFCRQDGATLVSDSHSLDDAAPTLVKLPSGNVDFTETEILRPQKVSNEIHTSSAPLTGPLYRRRRLSKSKAINSLAVLPFVNIGDDPETEYLSEGITESIINGLSQLPKLRVVPRSTVFRFKGRDVDPQEVGRLLGASAVLTGRVRQLNDLLIVKTELIDVAQESQLWGEQYRRKLTDIFALQEEIAREISEKLRLRLSGEEKLRLSKRYTENTEAYQLYLKGRYYTNNKRTTLWIKKGIEHFQQAIDLDPNYALAYAGLADAYAFLASSTGEVAPTEAYPKAKAAAMKALEIDEALAEAHSSLGFFRLLYDWDFSAAKREFKRALELNPDYGSAHDGYSFYLKATERHEEAIREAKRAYRLDPLSPFSSVGLGWAYYFARRYESAIEQGQKALEIDQNSTFAYWLKGLALAQQGELEESVVALNQAVIITGGGLTFEAHLGYAYALSGRREDAQKVLADLKEIAGQRYVPAYYPAIIYTGLGETDEALSHLERAYDERSGFLAFIKVEPILDPLRQEPRFTDLIRRIGLKP